MARSTISGRISHCGKTWGWNFSQTSLEVYEISEEALSPIRIYGSMSMSLREKDKELRKLLRVLQEIKHQTQKMIGTNIVRTVEYIKANNKSLLAAVSVDGEGDPSKRFDGLSLNFSNKAGISVIWRQTILGWAIKNVPGEDHSGLLKDVNLCILFAREHGLPIPPMFGGFNG